MDTLRGNLSGYMSSEDDGTNYDRGEEENYRELPPAAIGQDERRMQVRAYNFWASLLTDRNLPSIEDLDPENLPDFGPNSVLLDFSSGIEDPAIVFLGDKLAAECGTTGPIAKLSDVPSRSLLSRITDHHMQIIANQAPIGFEAEFVNQRGVAIMYRGILLPFSSDNESIDFIFGVINWKELADQQTTDELLLEIEQALEASPEALRPQAGLPGAPLTEWADGPLDSADRVGSAVDAEDEPEDAWPEALELVEEAGLEPATEDLPATSFGRRRRGLVADDDWSAVPDPEAAIEPEPVASLSQMVMPAAFEAAQPGESYADQYDGTLDLAGFAEVDDGFMEVEETIEEEPFATFAAETDDMALADWLAAARDLAYAALNSEDRSRQSLYAAIGRAYDFSLAAAEDPAGFAELVADAGLAVQDRAPMTPLVKLVFGANYDKTRLTEYAAALGHAGRIGLERGALENYLLFAPGGLKGVVQTERQLRREEASVTAAPRRPGERLARKLRKLDTLPLSEVATQGSEFTLLVARRLASGEVVLLGEVGDDTALLERAARRLLA
jgi:hypothetical protein